MQKEVKEKQSRTILFRGKRVDGLGWVQGYLFRFWGKAYILWSMVNDNPDMIEVVPETVCQFIGLSDKNDNPVWENDIVSRKDAKGNIRALGVVRYGAFNCSCCDGVFGWTFDGDVDIRDPYFYEVIGNIFDNPELLKGVEL